MKISRKIIIAWFILFIPFFSFEVYLLYNAEDKYEAQYRQGISGYIGSEFKIDNFIDSARRDTKINLTKSKITVVDFWFSECPPCLEDMKKFSKLIVGKEKEVNVISVSVNNFNLWRGLFNSSDKRFSFLSNPVSNWKNLVLNSKEDLSLRNDMPMDNTRLLQDNFQSLSFPMCFVLDKNGIIRATPFSVSKYLEIEVFKQNKFLYFLLNKGTWTANYYLIPFSFVEYSGYFWIIIIIGLGLLRFKEKYSLKKASLGSI